MNRSFDALSGSPGHTFVSEKQADGTYKVTSPSIEGKEWVADSEIDAIREATRDAYDMATRGEL
jgi:hypothetical protein